MLYHPDTLNSIRDAAYWLLPFLLMFCLAAIVAYALLHPPKNK